VHIVGIAALAYRNCVRRCAGSGFVVGAKDNYVVENVVSHCG
jgi:hypothetical protein